MSTAAVFTYDDSSTRQPSASPASLRAGSWLRPLCTVATDVVSLLLASVCTGAVLHGIVPPLASLSGFEQITVPVILLCGIGLYSTRAVHPAVELRNITSAMALAALILATSGPDLASGKAAAVGLLGFCFRIAFLALSRTVLRSVMARSGFGLAPTIIIGSGDLTQQVFHTIEKHRHLGLKAVAVLDSANPDPGVRRSQALMDQFEEAVRLAKHSNVSQVIIADAGLHEGDLEAVTYRYQGWFQRIVYVSSVSTRGGLSIRATDLSGLLGLEVDRPVLRHAPRLSKRLLDLSGACSAGLLLLPVFALIYAVIRLTSPGPAFYGQRRIGRNGQYFKAWKFRSMVVDADLVLREHLVRDSTLREEWERTHKLQKDPRILPVGHFLRQTSFDELPQLWNVIRGEMSLVGPRPIVDAEVAKYGESIQYYKAVRPGVTGMWQISGRSKTSYAERVRYDEYFVKNWSIWLDVYILFRTVKTVLLREGAC